MSRSPSGAPVLYLHVGLAKTGTTFIQETLSHWADKLQQEAIVVPGSGPAFHHRAAMDARGDAEPGAKVPHPNASGAWERMLASIRDVDGTVIISSEILSTIERERCAAALKTLSFGDLRLIVTARDPERQLVSSFQQRIKQGKTHEFKLVEENLLNRSNLHPAQQLDGVLDRWGSALTADHVHVITVPPSGSDPKVLWERFARVVGIDSDRFGPAPRRTNESLGVPETELLRRVNLVLGGKLAERHGHIVKNLYANQILAGASHAARLAVSESSWPVLDEIAERWIRYLERRGCVVTGDPEDLRPLHRRGVTPDSASAEEILDAAVRATAELLLVVVDLESPKRRAETDPNTEPAERHMAGRGETTTEVRRALSTDLGNRIT